MKRISALAGAATLAIAAGAVASGAPAEAVATYTLRGAAFQDNNKNDRYDRGDKVLAKKMVTLTDVKGRVLRKAATDAKGNYAFTGLRRGTYRVSMPLDKAAGTTMAGRSTINSTAKVRTVSVSLTKNTTTTFGFMAPVVKMPATATLVIDTCKVLNEDLKLVVGTGHYVLRGASFTFFETNKSSPMFTAVPGKAANLPANFQSIGANGEARAWAEGILVPAGEAKSSSKAMRIHERLARYQTDFKGKGLDCTTYVGQSMPANLTIRP